MLKTDANGDTLWTRLFGGLEYDEGNYVQQTQDGGYIIVGTTVSFGGSGGSQIYLIKTDAQGNQVWFRTMGSHYDNYGESVQQTSDGGYIIAGTGSFPWGLRR